MATINVPRGQLAAHDFALPAGAAQKVVFKDELHRVEVMTDGSAAVYFTTDGNAATIGGGETYKIPASPGVSSSLEVPAFGTSVSLISSGSPVCDVTSVGGNTT